MWTSLRDRMHNAWITGGRQTAAAHRLPTRCARLPTFRSFTVELRVELSMLLLVFVFFPNCKSWLAVATRIEEL